MCINQHIIHLRGVAALLTSKSAGLRSKPTQLAVDLFRLLFPLEKEFYLEVEGSHEWNDPCLHLCGLDLCLGQLRNRVNGLYDGVLQCFLTLLPSQPYLYLRGRAHRREKAPSEDMGTDPAIWGIEADATAPPTRGIFDNWLAWFADGLVITS